MATMKGVILAGGNGTRLRPITRVTNKHLLPVYNKPMIFYPIETLAQAGVKDILIVSGREHAGHFLNLLGSGKEFGVRLSYEVQEDAGGIAQALGLAEDFADGEKLMVILGDNIFERTKEILDAASVFSQQERGAMIMLKHVHDPERFGVAEIKGDRIVSIIEKPQSPTSNYAVTGLYFYDHQVFDTIRTLKPSGRGELEITDVNNDYLSRNELTYNIVAGEWTDAGTFDSLLRASTIVANAVRE